MSYKFQEINNMLTDRRLLHLTRCRRRRCLQSGARSSAPSSFPPSLSLSLCSLEWSKNKMLLFLLLFESVSRLYVDFSSSLL